MSEGEKKFWIVEREAKMKTERLFKAGSLSGHITGWNRLCDIWRSSERCRKELKALHFDFDQRNFDKNNGAEGKIPVLPSEWKHVGINTVVQRVNNNPNVLSLPI